MKKPSPNTVTTKTEQNVKDYQKTKILFIDELTTENVRSESSAVTSLH